MTVSKYMPCAVILELLAGCATQEPKIVTQTVSVPVAVSCVPASMPDAPDYPDTNAALTAPGVDGPRRYQIIVAGRALRIARINLLEQLVANCAKVKSGDQK